MCNSVSGIQKPSMCTMCKASKCNGLGSLGRMTSPCSLGPPSHKNGLLVLLLKRSDMITSQQNPSSSERDGDVLCDFSRRLRGPAV